MYVSMSRLRVAAAQSDALVAAFRRRAHLVDGAHGFVDLQVWRSDRDPEEVLMVSRWRDRAAFTAYMRYFEELSEDLERYGRAARAWEVHDTAHCLQWAILDAQGLASLPREIRWLTDVLAARGFPLEHLARNLELAADVVGERLAGDGRAVAAGLRSAAALVREATAA
jgi:heme-degrading monooxygenase HmoA